MAAPVRARRLGGPPHGILLGDPHTSRLGCRFLWLAALIGILGVVANALSLEVVRNGMLSIVAVISSLYPASTVALAFVIDRERPTRRPSWDSSSPLSLSASSRGVEADRSRR